MSEEEKQLQDNLYEFRMLEGRLNEVSAQREMLVRALIETRGGLTAIKGLDILSSSEVLIPIGGGVFIDAKTPPSDKFLVGIGADVIVEKNREETLNYLEDRIKEMENAVAGTDAHRSDLNNRMIVKREKINELIKKQQG